MTILAWIVVGLFVGALAKAVVPIPGGIIAACFTGIVGAVAGGVFQNIVVSPGKSVYSFSLWNLLLAIFGAVGVVSLYHYMSKTPRTSDWGFD